MNFIKRHWHVILVALLTVGLGAVVLLTSLKLREESPVAPTVPQEEPAADSGCISITTQGACNGKCMNGYSCAWRSQDNTCRATENRCGGDTVTRGYDGADKGNFCSGTTCDVSSQYSSSCYVNHYVSDDADDPVVTDKLVARAVSKASLGAQNCGAEQIDVTCGGKSDSVSRRYGQDCVAAVATTAPRSTATPTPTPRNTSTPTPTSTATPTPTGTPTATPTATPTVTGTPSVTATPTPTDSSTPTPTTVITPTPTTPQTPNVPVAGGPSVVGASVITGGILLLLLGLLF